MSIGFPLDNGLARSFGDDNSTFLRHHRHHTTAVFSPLDQKLIDHVFVGRDVSDMSFDEAEENTLLVVSCNAALPASLPPCDRSANVRTCLGPSFACVDLLASCVHNPVDRSCRRVSGKTGTCCTESNHPESPLQRISNMSRSKKPLNHHETGQSRRVEFTFSTFPIMLVIRAPAARRRQGDCLGRQLERQSALISSAVQRMALLAFNRHLCLV